MNKIALIVDSSCDMDESLRERFHIADYTHAVITAPDGTSFVADMDWKNFTQEEYFGGMAKGKKLYKTATCTYEEADEVFKKHLEAGEDILAITIGSAFGGMYNLYKGLKEKYGAAYPNQQIEVIDSCRYSGAIALLVMSASELIEEGKLTLSEITAKLENDKQCIHQMGPLDDLYFLNRSGRVSKTIAIFGTLAGVRPLADFQPNGFAGVIGKTKGEKKALQIGAEYVKQLIVDAPNARICIAHSYRPKEAEFYADLIKKTVNPKEVITMSVGQNCGANIGPGLVCAFFYGPKVSEGLVEETKVLNSIIAGK